MMKCDCCGSEQIKNGEFELLISGECVGIIPTYNISIIEFRKGKHICEDCMDKYMYIDCLFSDRHVIRAGVEYFEDGRERNYLR